MTAFMDPAAEIERERALIKQSNDRIGGIGTVFGAALMVLTVLLVQTNGRLNGLATFLSVIAGLAFTVAIIGFAVHLWPRTTGLPVDKSLDGYMGRMKAAAEAPSSEPDYKEGFTLQGIRRIKEISTRVILVGLVVMVVFGVLASLVN